MSCNDSRSLVLCADLLEPSVAGSPGGGFAPLPQVGFMVSEGQAVALGGALYQQAVVTGAVAQPVVEVGDGEVIVALGGCAGHEVEQHHGVGATGDGQNIAAGRRPDNSELHAPEFSTGWSVSR